MVRRSRKQNRTLSPGNLRAIRTKEVESCGSPGGRIRWLLKSAAGLLLLLAPIEARSETLVLVADEWCPYNCESESDRPGILVELARAALSPSGYTVEYKVLPWARALEEVRAGRYTGLIGAVEEEAPDLIYPKEPAAHSIDGFYVKKGNPWRYKGIDSLSTVSLGAIIDYGYGGGIQEYVQTHARDPKGVQLSSGEQPLETNVRKLLAGRVDVVVEDVGVMQYHLLQEKIGDKVELAGTSVPQPIFISFSPKDPKAQTFSELLSKGLKELEASGKTKEIFKKYGVEATNQSKEKRD